MTRTKTQLLKDLEDEEVGELDLI
jgi:hypothetical protein